ncbi:NHL repeat-containing protein [Pseudomonas sp. MC6]
MTQTHSISTPRSLDPTFARNGVLTLPIPGIAGDEAAAVLALPDAKLLVAIPLTGANAPVAIAMLNEDGSLDETFGAARRGFVEIALQGARISYVSGLDALEDDGWLIHLQYYSTTSNDVGLALVRLKNTGELNEAFGTNGMRYISYYGNPEPANAPRKASPPNTRSSETSHPRSRSAALLVGDKIVLLHSVFFDEAPLPVNVVIRLQADGSLDQSFNGSGYVIPEIATSSTAHGIAVQADGKVLVCGAYQDESGGRGVFLARLDTNGALDSQFNGGVAVLIPDDEGESFLQSISVREGDGRIIVAGRALRSGLEGGLIAAFTTSGAANLVFNGGKPLFSPLLKGLAWTHASQVGGSIVVVGHGESAMVTARFLANGKPDTAFNGTGHALFEDSAGAAFARGVAVMEDSRIVVCIELSVYADPSRIPGHFVRYLAGTPSLNNDPTFGEDGILRFPFLGFSGYDVRALLALPQNKLLVAVRLSTEGAPTRIVRLLENGALDTAFGGEDSGYVEIRLKESFYMSRILGFTPLSDGGWLVRAQYTAEGSNYSTGLVLVRQREDGQPQTSFGEQGVLYIPFEKMGGDAYTALAQKSSSGAAGAGAAGLVAQQLDEKIVVVSTVEDASGRTKGIVLRFEPNGSPDTTFNGTGFAFVELAEISPSDIVAQAAATQADGAVVICGNYFAVSAHGAFVTRFDATGKIDTGFGINGVVDVPHDQWISLDVAAIVDDKIVVAGGAAVKNVSHGLIAVLNFSGSYNQVFNGGQPLISSPVPQGVRWLHCVPRTDGSVIVCGSSGTGALDENLSAVTARFLADGSPDASFFGSGFTVFNESAGFEYPHGMAVMVDGRIVVGGVYFTDSGYDKGWVIRYLDKSA